jgi:hypothetical protein
MVARLASKNVTPHSLHAPAVHLLAAGVDTSRPDFTVTGWYLQ